MLRASKDARVQQVQSSCFKKGNQSSKQIKGLVQDQSANAWNASSLDPTPETTPHQQVLGIPEA